jgi:hypothetical protein
MAASPSWNSDLGLLRQLTTAGAPLIPSFGMSGFVYDRPRASLSGDQRVHGCPIQGHLLALSGDFRLPTTDTRRPVHPRVGFPSTDNRCTPLRVGKILTARKLARYQYRRLKLANLRMGALTMKRQREAGLRQITSNPGLGEPPQVQESPVLSDGQKNTVPLDAYLSLAKRTLLLWFFGTTGRLRGCRQEVRSFVHRISLQFGKRYCQPALPIGPVRHRDSAGHLQACTRTHACICGIESFSASRPWATGVDRENYRLGWEAGARWASHNRCSCM